jgi:putative nucleotidyltransferase with HDIG domain
MRDLTSFVQTLALSLEARDPFTRGHSARVARYARGLAGHLGLDPATIAAVELSAVLHDIGKIALTDSVLKKPGPLSSDELESVKQHPIHGARILEPLGLPAGVVHGVLYHHERMDGRGYPLGLAGDEIPVIARLVGVIDAFDALTVVRPYRGAFTVPEAFELLGRLAGPCFDREAVSAFQSWCKKEGLDRKLIGIEAARPLPRLLAETQLIAS